jgi:hypothetical protein
VKISRRLSSYFEGFFGAVTKERPVAEFEYAQKLVFEFGQYVDMLASASPNRFHHVYEWDMVGQIEGRLFELSTAPTGAGTVITYRLEDSTTPNRNGVLFAKKAEVMESGETALAGPTDGRKVPIMSESGLIFRVGPFVVVPGGDDTNGVFRETFISYFTNRVGVSGATSLKPTVLTKSGGYNDGKRIYDRLIGK